MPSCRNVLYSRGFHANKTARRQFDSMILAASSIPICPVEPVGTGAPSRLQEQVEDSVPYMMLKCRLAVLFVRESLVSRPFRQDGLTSRPSCCRLVAVLSAPLGADLM